MYGPAPPRRKKTAITRSKGGCLNCRSRRKKCDEQRPKCGGCVKLGKPCERPPGKVTFRAVSFAPESKSTSKSSSRGWSSSSFDWNNYSNDEAVVSDAQAAENVGQPLELQSYETEEISFDGGNAGVEICPDRSGSWDLQDCILSQLDSSIAWAPKENFAQLIDSPSHVSANVDVDTSSTDVDEAFVLHRPQLHGDVTTITSTDSRTFSNNHSNSVILATPSTFWWPLPSPSSDNRLSLEMTRKSGQWSFYFDNWEKFCIPALHPAFGRLDGQIELPYVLRDALLALSACQLSRMTPRGKPLEACGTPGLSFRPDPNHQAVCLESYSTAVSILARMSDTVGTNDFRIVFTAMILLAHFELLMGDFPHFRSHSMGVDRLLKTLSKQVDTLPDHWACELIANWSQARAHKRWLRLHFSTPVFHRSIKPLECSAWLIAVLEEADDCRSIIIRALCECLRLKSVAFLDRWESNSDPNEKSFWSNTPAATTQISTLDRWHNRLTLSDMPIESFLEAPSLAHSANETSLSVRPLRFTSHGAAMNYAYYVVSRLLLCGIAEVDSELYPTDPCEGSDYEANSWALLLARITAGLDWYNCTKLNTFTIGLCTLFLPCALVASDTRISLWLQDWLEQRYSTTALEEGSFPVLQILQVLRAIHRERREGRVVKAVFACDEDDGGAGKYGSYMSQNITALLVYGLDTVTGQRFARTAVL